MKKLTLACLLFLAGTSFAQQNPNAKINALVDLSHSFSFYSDGRFATQYLGGQNSAMCWGNLYDFDLSNTNLLVLLACDDKSPYTKQDIATIKNYVKQGGGLVLLGNATQKSQNALASVFGAEFGITSDKSLKANRYTTRKIVSQGKTATLNILKPKAWDILVQDETGVPVLATSSYGKGTVVVGSRSISGSHPNASDSINTTLWKPLLLDVAKGKQIDAAEAYEGRGWDNLGNREVRGKLDISFTDYLKPYADAMFDISARCMPVIEKRMGIPLSPGMGSKIMLLSTDGGGFSSGESIALAVWWGGFPDKEDSMIEFITHESVHSWVLPFAEIWNEPIATYVGNLVMIDMGHKEEGEKRIQDVINRAKASDPDFNLYDVDGKSSKAGVVDLPTDKVNNVHWGKTYWIWEQLRAKNSNIVADYFKAKRQYAVKDKVKTYDANNTVAVMSIATGEDLFPWFRSIGFDVERSKADITF